VIRAAEGAAGAPAPTAGASPQGVPQQAAYQQPQPQQAAYQQPSGQATYQQPQQAVGYGQPAGAQASYQPVGAPPSGQATSGKPEKKSAAKIVIGIIVGLLLLCGITVGIILGVTSCAINTAKTADYYEVGGEKVASVKLAIGEREVTGVSSWIEAGSDNYRVTYAVTANQADEVERYLAYLVENEGFLYSPDNPPFDGASAHSGIQVGKAASKEGYGVVVQADFDSAGYTITVMVNMTDVSLFSAQTASAGSQDPEATFAGDWYVVSAEGTFVVTEEEAAAARGQLVLSLNADDTVELNLAGEVLTGTWALKDATTVTLTLNGKSADAVLAADGRLALSKDGATLYFAKEGSSPTTTPSAPTPAPAPSPANSTKAQQYIDIFNLENYHIYTLSNSVLGSASNVEQLELDTELEMWRQGGMTCVAVSSPDFTARIISRDGKEYIVMDDQQIVYVSATSDEQPTNGLTERNPTLIGTGSEYFYDQVYDYEEYSDSSAERQRFFFGADGGLIGIRTLSSEGLSDMVFFTLDQDIPSTTFDVPNGYQVIEG
jgi:hypothetical protein